MRGYSNSNFENSPEEKAVNQEEQVFVNFLLGVERFLYREFPQSLVENSMKKNWERIVEYFRNINEEIISSDELTNAIVTKKPIIKKLVSSEFFAGTGFTPRRKVQPTTSYIPSIDDTTQNVIRIGLTEELKVFGEGIQYLNGTIDILENGQIVVNNFSKDMLKIQFKNTDKGSEISKDEDGNTIYTSETSEASIEESIIDKQNLEKMCQMFNAMLKKVNYPMEQGKSK